MSIYDEIYRFYYVKVTDKKKYFAKCRICEFRIYASTREDMEKRMKEHYFEVHHNPRKRPISQTTKTPSSPPAPNWGAEGKTK